MLSKLIEYFKTKSISFNLYALSSIILLIPSFILFVTKHQYFIIYSEFTMKYILIPLFSIAFMIDIFTVIKSLWKTIFGKIIYSIFGYFALTYSQSLAKNSIYHITNENPDFYQTSTQFLSAIYLIPSWIISINYVISIIIIIGSIIIFPIMFFKFEKITSVLNKLSKIINVDVKIQKHNIIHMIFIPIASITFFANSMAIIPTISKVFDNIFISKSIIKYSYYPNKTCRNVNINQYIKLIETSKVSVSNINTIEYLLLNYGANNKKITFKTKECVRF